MTKRTVDGSAMVAAACLLLAGCGGGGGAPQAMAPSDAEPAGQGPGGPTTDPVVPDIEELRAQETAALDDRSTALQAYVAALNDPALDANAVAALHQGYLDAELDAERATLWRVVAEAADADHLSLGPWSTVPTELTDVAAYDVTLDGATPGLFTVDNLRVVTGEAVYIGSATGQYAEGTMDAPATGTFDAYVTFHADFGTADQLGAISCAATNRMRQQRQSG